MLSYIQQWMIYAVGALLLGVSVFAGVQTVRLSGAQKDLVIATQETEAQRSKVTIMATTMKQMAIIGDSLQFNFNKAYQEAQKTAQTHKKIAEALAAQTVPKDCNAAVNWAVEQAEIIEKGW